MSASEMSRLVKLRQIDGDPRHVEASPEERAALAKRFGVVAINRLVADVALEREVDEIAASGRFEAELVQTCGISGEDFPVRIGEPFAFRFVPEAERGPTEEEVELDETDLDDIEYSGDAIDIGEAVAQSLGLAIDPYAEGPNAEVVRRQAGILPDDAPTGALADALRALKKD